GLPDHRCTHYEAESDRDPKVHRDACSLQVVADGRPGEVTPRERLQAGLASNSPRQEVSILTLARVNEDEGHLFTGAANVVHRVGVLCVNNGEGRERRRCLADADDNRAMVVSSTTLPRASGSPGHMCWNPALSMIIASGCFRFSTAPKIRCGTTPASVASSTPSKMTCCSSPSRACATVRPL